MGATRLYGVKALKRESEGRTTSAVGRNDLLVPTRFGLSAYPIYVARIPAAPFAVAKMSPAFVPQSRGYGGQADRAADGAAGR